MTKGSSDVSQSGATDERAQLRAVVDQAAHEHTEIAVEDLGVGTLVGYVEYCDESGYALRGRYLLWGNLVSATTDTHDAKEDAKAWEAGMPDPSLSRSEASPQELANRIIRAQLVADNWRKAALEWGSDQIDARTMAHPLRCVLGALDGGKRPEDLGVNPESDEGRVLRAMEKA